MQVLLVDDEPNLLLSLEGFLKTEGIGCLTAPEGRAAQAILQDRTVDAVVLDLRMPGMDGMSLLRWIRESGPDVPVIMASAHGDVGDAVEAMKLGAYDYLVKPFDPDELVLRLRKAARERALRNGAEADRRTSEERVELIGRSPAILEAARLIEKAAVTPATILLTGESGTGKEVAARLAHQASRRSGPFIAVNLGAIPETLVESELFGHEKGAFTGADFRRQGFFELAQGGTLFLDEIGDLPLHLQVKLLRALQERKIQRLGGNQAIPVDARILAATNRDLEALVRQGRFREDLYYRINVIRIVLPPLRDRSGDIAMLAEFFLRKLALGMGRHVDGLSPQALKLLEGHSYPGNVRELQNAMERALILSEKPVLQAEDFHFFAPASPAGGFGESAEDDRGPAVTLAELERRAILAALERNSGRREQSARELGITRRTLLTKLKEYGVSP